MTIKCVRGVSRDLMRVTFRDWLCILDNQADLLVTLWERNGEGLPRRALCNAISKHRPISVGALHERVRVLRSAMEVEAIDFDEVAGYRLTDVGLAECAQALREMGGVLNTAHPQTPIVECAA